MRDNKSLTLVNRDLLTKGRELYMPARQDFPIGFWNVLRLEECGPEWVDIWCDLGITQAMSPFYNQGNRKQDMLNILDKAGMYGIKVIVCDYRTDWRMLTNHGEKSYRSLFRQALADFGRHPAVMGFFVGDEPDASEIEDALKAVCIQREIEPDLVPYLNLLPWFDWIGERMGAQTLAAYLDMVVKGGVNLLSYNCYTQMLEGDKGWNDYFNNLREYMIAKRRLNVPFQTILLSSGHYYYRCPNEDDIRWQLSTAVAHGASGVSWFLINTPFILDNFRQAPVDQFGCRTQSFGWLSATNRLFQKHCGNLLTELKISHCHHVNIAYGGMPLFEPYGKVADINSEIGVPLIISEFEDMDGNLYWMVVNNSITESTQVTVRFIHGTQLEMCNFGNVFGPVPVHNDPVGERKGEGREIVSLWLAPGQLALLREKRLL